MPLARSPAPSAVVIAIGRPRSVVRVAEGTWKEPPELGTVLPTPDLDAAAVARIVDPATVGLQDLARDAGATRVLEVPIGPDLQPNGRLFAFLAGSPLFVEDDLALLTLLAALTARAIEREEAVAERTTLVNELRRTNDELAQASAAKSDFLAAMSHELRTPLNSIIGFSELMLAPVNRAEGLRPLDVADWATHIHGAGLQLLDLINEVLDLAKIEAGRLELRHERFDVPSLLSRTVDAMRPLADRRQIEIDLAPAEPITIDADPARVRQIVYNLLSNAIKFSPDDGRDRRHDARRSAARSGSRSRTAGRGSRGRTSAGCSRHSSRRRAAEPRRRARDWDSRSPASSRSATAAASSWSPSSEPAACSRSCCPIVRPQALAAQQPAESQGPLVLVIEDDVSSAELLRAYLETDGYRVTVAPTGEDGIDRMRHQQPDAVILDILLPGIDGWEVMQRARAEPATRDIPILVVSLIDDAELGLALGAVDFFTKPVDRSVLLLRLRRLLDTEAGTHERPTILAIDDEPIVVEMYRAMLEPNGFDVVVATSGTGGRGCREARATGRRRARPHDARHGWLRGGGGPARRPRDRARADPRGHRSRPDRRRQEAPERPCHGHPAQGRRRDRWPAPAGCSPTWPSRRRPQAAPTALVPTRTAGPLRTRPRAQLNRRAPARALDPRRDHDRGAARPRGGG